MNFQFWWNSILLHHCFQYLCIHLFIFWQTFHLRLSICFTHVNAWIHIYTSSIKIHIFFNYTFFVRFPLAFIYSLTRSRSSYIFRWRFALLTLITIIRWYCAEFTYLVSDLDGMFEGLIFFNVLKSILYTS